MADLKEVMVLLRNKKTYLQKKYAIRYLAVFGSISRQTYGPDSDVDILVDFTKTPGIGFIDLADELEDMLQAKVDLVSRNAIKPAYFEKIQKDIKYV